MADGDVSLSAAARDIGIARDTLNKVVKNLGIKPGILGAYRVLSAEQVAAVKANLPPRVAARAQRANA